MCVCVCVYVCVCASIDYSTLYLSLLNVDIFVSILLHDLQTHVPLELEEKLQKQYTDLTNKFLETRMSDFEKKIVFSSSLI